MYSVTEEASHHCNVLGAWISVVWFLLFGLLCALMMQGAPGWMICIPWAMVVLAVAAGVLLLWWQRRLG